NPDRLWEMIERHGITIFGISPTAIRMLMRSGEDWVKKHDLHTLRILGSTGEPWDPPSPWDKMYTDPSFKGTIVKHPIPGETEGYMTPDEVLYTKSLYAGLCSFVDKWDGVLLDYLKSAGMLDNTLLVFVSDHGEPFGEHGIIRKAKPLPYEELVRIPFFIRHPEGLGAGKEYDALVQNCDITPTILNFLGINTRFMRITGANLLPLMKGEVEKVHDYAYIGHYNQSCRINDHEWAYIHYFIDRPHELFRYVEDREMKNNVIEKHPQKAEELKKIMFDYVKSLGGPDWSAVAVQAMHKH
ncbi:MAG: sulfatase-like hydrolase/transferase, partial [Candidatus Sumerlaeota bacterium]|nr:sulfatase-like hydrolase/transferase [Candidatus Sumerlaeota bacterium]